MTRKRSTRIDALTLAQATAIKSGLQLLTPIALVRLLDQAEFGEYRLFWLIANTTVMLLALGVDRSLLYFIPKSTVDDRRRFVSQTMVYFLGAGVFAGLMMLTGSIWLPDSVGSLTEPRYVLAMFIVVWVASLPVNVLPNADRNIVWQSRIIIAISILRAIVVVGAAWLTSDLQTVFIALLAWAALQWVILIYYVGTRYGLKLPMPTRSSFDRQLSYAIPFGLSRIFTGSRRQGEQWIVAYLFTPASLAVFSIGMSFLVVLRLVRSSVGNVLLPKMSRSSANEDMGRALELNSRGNIAVVMFAAPTVAFIWFFAEPLIRFLYTQTYIDAVPILRVYLLTLLVMSTELATVLMILEQGRHVAKVNAMVLIVSLLISFAGGKIFGLTGVALGALFGEITSRFFNYRHASRLLEIPVKRLQDWGTLIRIALAALLAGGASYLVITNFLQHGSGDIVTLCLGAAVFGIAYVIALWTLRLSWTLKAMADRGDWR
jgi:O-antigen/teichoic acid export membrane protein